MLFLNRSDTNWAVQLHKTARCLDCAFRIAKAKELICVFVFAYANCWFSHEAAQLLVELYMNKKIDIK